MKNNDYTTGEAVIEGIKNGLLIVALIKYLLTW